MNYPVDVVVFFFSCGFEHCFSRWRTTDISEAHKKDCLFGLRHEKQIKKIDFELFTKVFLPRLMANWNSWGLSVIIDRNKSTTQCQEASLYRDLKRFFLYKARKASSPASSELIQAILNFNMPEHPSGEQIYLSYLSHFDRLLDLFPEIKDQNLHSQLRTKILEALPFSRPVNLIPKCLSYFPVDQGNLKHFWQWLSIFNCAPEFFLDLIQQVGITTEKELDDIIRFIHGKKREGQVKKKKPHQHLFTLFLPTQVSVCIELLKGFDWQNSTSSSSFVFNGFNSVSIFSVLSSILLHI